VFGVPHTKTFLLEGGDMVEPRINEALHDLGLHWTRDKSARKDLPFLVPQLRGKISYDPNINPAIRGLIAVELCAVDGEDEDHVVPVDLSRLDCLKIIGSIEEITIRRGTASVLSA
jgi:hypothetical protein